MTTTDRKRQQGGFVLVVVLTLLVVLALLAGTVASSASAALERARTAQDRFEGELEMFSTRETVLFMLASQHRNAGGLSPDQSPPSNTASLDADIDDLTGVPRGNEIRLDGRPYRGVGEARFALQDDRGLISPQWAGKALMHGFYAQLGVPPEEWAALEAKRMDYQDPDKLHRLSGAEEEHYLAAGKPPPPNRPPATPLEYRRILQWDQVLAPYTDAQLLEILSVTQNAMINLNTATVEVLKLLPGMDADKAARLVALRQRQPFLSLYALQREFPFPDAIAEGLTLFPNISGNLILWDRRFGTRRVVHWTLAQAQLDVPPWHIDYEVILPRDNRTAEAMVETPATPLFATPDPAG